MPNKLFTLMLLIACCLPMSAQEPAVPEAAPQSGPWEETVSYSGRFRVKTPGYMTAKADTIKTRLGEQVYHTYFYQAPDKRADNLFYMVSYVDYPEGTIHSDSTDFIEEFFTASAEEAAFSITGDLVYSNPQDWYGYPGRIWRVDYLKGEAIIKTRAFVVGDRYYNVQVIMLKANSLNPSAEKFFDSFYLLNGEASGN